MKNKIVIGYAPTRRNIFSAPDAIIYANKIRERLEELEIEFVDLSDITSDGLLFDDEGVEKAYEKFSKAKVDGLFIPHVNFGTEFACARLARKLDVPVLLWGPLDEAPESDGSRLRDSQCGLFATGKVLRRFNVKFTYLKNCRVEDKAFSKGLDNFIRVCNVVKTFNKTRILQIGPRPFDFWSIMCNEGELLERFNIQLSPIPMNELYDEMVVVDEVCKNEKEATIQKFRSIAKVSIDDDALSKMASLKVAIDRLADRYGCNAGAIQCWTDFQDKLGITPYGVEALLQDEGFPVACETDIHGAITMLLTDAASFGDNKSMFVDLTVRHPENKNGELLQHLGVFPFSTAEGKPELIESHFVFDYPGSVGMQAKRDDMTVVRFDGDHGDYSMLLGHAKGIEGPYNQGSYLWAEFENLNRLEAKVVYGPYIHHVSTIYGDLVPVLYEACKYIGITPDLYDDIEDSVQAQIWGD